MEIRSGSGKFVGRGVFGNMTEGGPQGVQVVPQPEVCMVVWQEYEGSRFFGGHDLSESMARKVRKAHIGIAYGSLGFDSQEGVFYAEADVAKHTVVA